MGKSRRAKKPEEGNMDTTVEPLSDRLTIRVDPDIRRVWQKLADEDGRALANWVVRMVETNPNRKKDS
jgi:predicted HicB family RNase H-like nuclease